MCDGNGGTDTATVTLSVGANAAPVANDDSYATDEDNPLNGGGGRRAGQRH